MDAVQTTNETGTGNIEGREITHRKLDTDEFDLDEIKDGANLIDMRNKTIEIVNKNIKLTKYLKGLYKKKAELDTTYELQKKEIERREIEANSRREKKERLQITELTNLIKSQIDPELISKIKHNENEISICEVTGKNHSLVSDQIKNYNISDTTFRKSINSNIL